MYGTKHRVVSETNWWQVTWESRLPATPPPPEPSTTHSCESSTAGKTLLRPRPDGEQKTATCKELMKVVSNSEAPSTRTTWTAVEHKDVHRRNLLRLLRSLHALFPQPEAQKGRQLSQSAAGSDLDPPRRHPASASTPSRNPLWGSWAPPQTNATAISHTNVRTRQASEPTHPREEGQSWRGVVVVVVVVWFIILKE